MQAAWGWRLREQLFPKTGEGGPFETHSHKWNSPGVKMNIFTVYLFRNYYVSSAQYTFKDIQVISVPHHDLLQSSPVHKTQLGHYFLALTVVSGSI